MKVFSLLMILASMLSTLFGYDEAKKYCDRQFELAKHKAFAVANAAEESNKSHWRKIADNTMAEVAIEKALYCSDSHPGKNYLHYRLTNKTSVPIGVCPFFSEKFLVNSDTPTILDNWFYRVTQSGDIVKPGEDAESWQLNDERKKALIADFVKKKLALVSAYQSYDFFLEGQFSRAEIEKDINRHKYIVLTITFGTDVTDGRNCQWVGATTPKEVLTFGGYRGAQLSLAVPLPWKRLPKEAVIPFASPETDRNNTNETKDKHLS